MKPESTDTGMNRTGIGMSPIHSKQQIEGAANFPPTSPGSEQDLLIARQSYNQEPTKVGSIPPPATVKGAAMTVIRRVQGEKMPVFIDKIGERLAFERTGSRLYEALIGKFQQTDALPGGPTLAELQRIHDEELSHFIMLNDTLVEMGADPTVVTPAADVTAVASMGLIQVLGDPRTTFCQALHAIHIAELADNDGWAMLIQLATALGHDQLAARFTEAQAAEVQHLVMVRQWMSNLTMAEGMPGKTP